MTLHQLDRGEVHVLLARLPDFYRKLAQLESLLSIDEQARARRFHKKENAWDFTIARALLRRLLSDYVGTPAQDIRFAYSRLGKPELNNANVNPGFAFNLSHSGEIAAIAFSNSGNVGVDVEHIDRPVEMDLLAPRILSPYEKEKFVRISGEDRAKEFFRYWTHKEAYVKATGEGIGVDLTAITLHWPDCGTKVRLTDQRNSNTSPWSLHTITPGFGYVGAVAVNTEGITPIVTDISAEAI